MNADVARILDRWIVDPDDKPYLIQRYTADDLAAWLTERFGNRWRLTTTDRSDAPYMSGIINDDWQVPVDWVHSPTILACLEQLVLQIGAS